MTAADLRQKYLDFFSTKERRHKIVSSASLLPENDPTTLFTGSGMQPMVPYLLGEKYPGGETRIVNSQKCFRSGDIEEVGDNRHTTFFEMLGNWSLGDYFKKDQIEWMFEFLTQELKLDPSRLYVSVYRGNDEFNISREIEAVKIWQEQFKSVGIDARDVDFAETKGMQDGRIFYYSDSENWWSRAGCPENMPDGELGGPDSEMFWDFGKGLGLHEKSEWKNDVCHPACDCGRFMEIGNNVFMQYKKANGKFEELKNKNIDFGGGLERLMAAVLDTPDVFLTDLFELSRKKIEELSGKKYKFSEGDLGFDKMPECWISDIRSMRIIIDHLKGATFLINDGAVPSNKDQGYFTRRLIRRAVRFGHQLGIDKNFTKKIAQTVVETYGNYYKDLVKNQEKIYQIIDEEENKFKKTLVKGLKKMEAIFNTTSQVAINRGDSVRIITGQHAFDLYQSYGFPIEMFIEELDKTEIEYKQEKIEQEFNEELKKHQELSRSASVGKFKGGLAGDDCVTTQLHTVTHLMLAGLQKALGDDVSQRGSNITPERIRFDFSYDEKMTDEQKEIVENYVNESLCSGADMKLNEMSKDEARETGVTGAFWEKYPEQVKVYTIESKDGTVYSRELCGGPHVKSLSEINGKFKIMKEKSSGAGVRRIKAVIE